MIIYYLSIYVPYHVHRYSICMDHYLIDCVKEEMLDIFEPYDASEYMIVGSISLSPFNIVMPVIWTQFCDTLLHSAVESSINVVGDSILLWYRKERSSCILFILFLGLSSIYYRNIYSDWKILWFHDHSFIPWRYFCLGQHLQIHQRSPEVSKVPHGRWS